MAGSSVIVIIAGIALGIATGPAPNSGDGVSDSSGMDKQSAPQSETGEAPGPAPNSGDGVSDGSGF